MANAFRMIPFVTFTLGALFLSCKAPVPTAGSDTQSIDNLAGKDFKFNDCRRTVRAAFSPQADRIDAGDYSSDIKTALENVPEGIRAAFFAEPINGRIALVSGIGEVCPAAKSAGSGMTDLALSCIKSNGETGPLTIYIKKETDADGTRRNIHHSMVRAFGYVLAEAVAPSLPNSDVITKVSDELAIRLLADVSEKESKGVYSLSMFSSLLPASVLVKGLSEEDRRRAYGALSVESRQKYREAVLAETFDSLNCSDATRTVFLRDFPRVSGSAYASLDKGQGSTVEDYLKVMQAEEALNQISGGLLDSLSTNVTPPDQGFGLWGRWGSGNGPLRQGVRAWGNHRAQGGGLMNVRRFQNGGGLIFRRPWLNPTRWGSSAQ